MYRLRTAISLARGRAVRAIRAHQASVALLPESLLRHPSVALSGTCANGSDSRAARAGRARAATRSAHHGRRSGAPVPPSAVIACPWRGRGFSTTAFLTSHDSSASAASRAGRAPGIGRVPSAFKASSRIGSFYMFCACLSSVSRSAFGPNAPSAARRAASACSLRRSST